MVSKRGTSLIFLFILIVLSIGFVASADTCTLRQGSCNSGEYSVMKLSSDSNAHGAGRVMGRGHALSTLKFNEIKKQLEEKGIFVRAGSKRTMTEEAPEVYKNIDDVVDVMHNLGIFKKVARLKPLVVVIG